MAWVSVLTTVLFELCAFCYDTMSTIVLNTTCSLLLCSLIGEISYFSSDFQILTQDLVKTVKIQHVLMIFNVVWG